MVTHATKHFTWSELGDPPSRCRQGSLVLAQTLEALRRRCGNRPLHLLSGYRTPQHNAEVGGALHSQHLLGRAADIPEGYATTEEALMVGFIGVGSKGDWAIHVDVRTGPHAHWTY